MDLSSGNVIIDEDTITYDANGSIQAIGVVPIGAIVPLLKNYTNCPTMPSNFVECDGAAISDAESPFDGQNAPDLNTTQRFIRGSSTSGTTGGSDTINTHTIKNDQTSANNTTHIDSPYNNMPAYYEVVWIMRIK